VKSTASPLKMLTMRMAVNSAIHSAVVQALTKSLFLLRFACPEGAQVGSGVSEVMVAFVASLAGMWRNHDDRALRLGRLLA
jgi:hypothetical protein